MRHSDNTHRHTDSKAQTDQIIKYRRKHQP